MNWIAAACLFYVASEWAPSLMLPILAGLWASLQKAPAEGELLQQIIGGAKRMIYFDLVPRWLLRAGCVACLVAAL